MREKRWRILNSRIWRRGTREVCHIPIRYLCWLLKTVVIILSPVLALRSSVFWPSNVARTPIQVAARSKSWVCGRSPAGIVGLKPAGCMDVCRECCVLLGRGLCDELISHPEESYRVWCVWVWSRNLMNEEAVTHWGLLRQKKSLLRKNDCFFKQRSPAGCVTGIRCFQCWRNWVYKHYLGDIPV